MNLPAHHRATLEFTDAEGRAWFEAMHRAERLLGGQGIPVFSQAGAELHRLMGRLETARHAEFGDPQ